MTYEESDPLTPNQEKVRVKLAGMYVMCGSLLASTDVYAGLVIVKSADMRSEEIVRACRHNKTAWKWLERLVNGSDVGAALIGHGLMVYAILVHAGRLKGDVNHLALFGLAEHQVMAPPPNMPTEEELNAYRSANGHSGNKS